MPYKYSVIKIIITIIIVIIIKVYSMKMVYVTQIEF